MPKNKKGKIKNKKERARPKFDVHNEAVKALWGVVLVIFFLLSVLALIDKAGEAGSVFKKVAESLLGLGRFAIPFTFLGASYILFSSKRRNSYIPLFTGGFLFFSGTLGILSIFAPEGSMGGGYWGRFFSLIFVKLFGEPASAIVFVGLIFSSLIISFNIRPAMLLSALRKRSEEEKAQDDLSQDASGRDIKEGGKTEFKVRTWQGAENPKFETNSKTKNQKQDERDDKRG
ncbi:MAG: DNA translocase FtsK 4TM domain-containing protein, partial [Actinomycetota bacterium]